MIKEQVFDGGILYFVEFNGILFTPGFTSKSEAVDFEAWLNQEWDKAYLIELASKTKEYQIQSDDLDELREWILSQQELDESVCGFNPS